MRAGICELVFRNADDRWNPWNELSAHYNPTTGYPGLLPNPSFENSLSDWGVETNCTLSNQQSPNDTGNWSMRLVATAGADMSAITTSPGTAVAASTQYTLSAMFTPNTSTRSVRVALIWLNSGGGVISTSTGSSVTEAASGWTRAVVTATSPGTAVTARVRVQVLAPGAGEAHYVDTVVLKAGSDTYSATVTGLQPMKKVRVSAEWPWLSTNILSNPQHSTNLDYWGVEANCTLARVSSPVYRSTTNSMQMTAVASGDMSALNPTSLPYVPVTVGNTYTAVAHFTPNSTTRQVRVTIVWYDASHASTGSTVGTAVTEAATGWTRVIATGQAPLSTVSARVRVQVLSAGVGEAHFVNTVLLAPGSDGGLQYIFTGYVESFEQAWPVENYAETTILAVDGFKVLSLARAARTDFYDAVIADTPAGYFRLNETGIASAVNGVIAGEDDSGNNRDGTYKGTPEFRQPSALAAELGTSVTFKRGDRATIGINSENYGGLLEVPMSVCPSGTTNFSFECWCLPYSIGQYSTGVPVDRLWHVFLVGSQLVILSIQSDGKLRFAVTDGANGGTLDASTALTVGRWNHVVAVKSGTTGPANWRIYLNGADVSTGASTTGTGNCNLTANSSLIGGYEVSAVVQGAFDGLIDEVAIYHSALSSTRVTAHFDAAFGLSNPALTGARIGKLLDVAGHPTADRSLDAGQFSMQGITGQLYENSPLPLVLDYVDSEGYPAAFFFNGQGNAVFHDRAHSTPSSSGTFGDSSGEVNPRSGTAGSPPTRDDLDLWTTVVLQADDGVAQRAADSTAAARYVNRTLSRTGLKNADDSDVATVASSLLSRYKTPADRVKSLVIQPIANPATLFPHVLGRELTDRITYKRASLPGGGTTLSLDERIEGIEHEFDADHWQTTWQLSPT